MKQRPPLGVGGYAPGIGDLTAASPGATVRHRGRSRSVQRPADCRRRRQLQTGRHHSQRPVAKWVCGGDPAYCGSRESASGEHVGRLCRWMGGWQPAVPASSKTDWSCLELGGVRIKADLAAWKRCHRNQKGSAEFVSGMRGWS